MDIITLTTDFGMRDGNVGVMKGVILERAPHVTLVDLSHMINAQAIHEGAWVLKRAWPYFPDGTIHVAVVDPGVGTARRGLAAWVRRQYFVGPDNGLLTHVLRSAARAGETVRCVALTEPRYWRAEVSAVFHGRDVFAPVAAHLALGVALEALGPAVADPVQLALPEVARVGMRVRGVVVHVDHFGNVITNITRADLAGAEVRAVHVAGAVVTECVRTFGERAPGALIALYSSTDDLMVSVVNGSAAAALGGVQAGAAVEVELA